MKDMAAKVVAIILFLMFLSCILPVSLTMTAWLLLLGWVSYLARVVPQIRVNWSAVGGAIVSLGGVLILGQLTARWLWRESAVAQSQRGPWRIKWTFAATAIVLLMFICGLGAVGMTHQAAWIARSEGPVVEIRRNKTAIRVMCSANMKSIGQAMLLYAAAHGNKLPDTISDLALSEDIGASVFLCPAISLDRDSPIDLERFPPTPSPAEVAKKLTGDSVHNNYVYHGRGLKVPLPPNRVILCEPISNHKGDGMNVLFADLRVLWVTPEEAKQFLSVGGE